MQWQETIEFLGSATALSCVLGFLGKKAIEAFIAGRIDSYKNDLEKISLEHSVRFSSLHTKRAEIIADFYELLTALENMARLLATPIREKGEPSRDKIYTETAELYFKLYDKYNKSRIYFSEELCQLIDKFLDKSKQPISFYKVAEQILDQSPYFAKEKVGQDIQKKLFETWEEVEQNVPKARIAIEKEFRTILGVA